MKNYELIQITERYNTIVAKASTAYALGILAVVDAAIDTYTFDFVVKVKVSEAFPSDFSLTWKAESKTSADKYEIFCNEDQADELEAYLDELLLKARKDAEQKVKVINALNS